jgi:hypothetical protein
MNQPLPQAHQDLVAIIKQNDELAADALVDDLAGLRVGAATHGVPQHKDAGADLLDSDSDLEIGKNRPAARRQMALQDTDDDFSPQVPPPAARRAAQQEEASSEDDDDDDDASQDESAPLHNDVEDLAAASSDDEAAQVPQAQALTMSQGGDRFELNSKIHSMMYVHQVLTSSLFAFGFPWKFGVSSGTSGCVAMQCVAPSASKASIAWKRELQCDTAMLCRYPV